MGPFCLWRFLSTLFTQFVEFVERNNFKIFFFPILSFKGKLILLPEEDIRQFFTKVQFTLSDCRASFYPRRHIVLYTHSCTLCGFHDKSVLSSKVARVWISFSTPCDCCEMSFSGKEKWPLAPQEWVSFIPGPRISHNHLSICHFKSK